MEIIQRNAVIDEVLSHHHLALGKDLLGYSGHCYRLLNYVRFLGMDDRDLPLMEVAIAFHDLGVWTDQTMDYIEPSVKLAEQYVLKEELEIDLQHLRLLIAGHHHLSGIENSPLAELLRKADLIDLSFGAISCGLPKKVFREIKKHFPYNGFQTMIFKKVALYAISHPLRPFPMMNA
jgi:hypothetical protein